MGNERKQNVYERLIKFNRIPEGGRERERERDPDKNEERLLF